MRQAIKSCGAGSRPSGSGVAWRAVRLAAWGLLCWLIGGAAGDAVAQFNPPRPLSKTTIEMPTTLPDGTRGRGSGFNATLEISDLFGVGYSGVNLRLTSTLGPTAATRQLSLRITPIDRHVATTRALQSEVPVSFEQGQSQVTVRTAVPKWSLGNAFRFEIYEDGVALPNYSAEVGSALPGFAIRRPADLLVREVTNDLVFVGVPVPSGKTPDLLFGGPEMRTRWQSAAASDLPLDWRVLREIDCLVISLDLFGRDGDRDSAERLSGPQIDALRQWLLMGGTLVLISPTDRPELPESLRQSVREKTNKGEYFQQVVTRASAADVDRIINFEYFVRDLKQRFDALANRSSADSASADSAAADSAAADSAAADSAAMQITVPIDDGTPTGTTGVLDEEDLGELTAWLKRERAQSAELKQSWTRGELYQLGMGQVVSLPRMEFDRDLSMSIINTLVDFHRSPMLQRGVDPIMGDLRYRNWLIPGVAEPPVYTFMGILTLFVLLVGPVAYRWTTRGHRSHLMFLIAPALAIITTALMFTYSILADGFGTTVRVRQLTWIDGASGDAVERTRSTYFSGISPRDGLRFSGEAEVMAYPVGGQTTLGELPVEVDEIRHRVVVDPSLQIFSPSLLPSRSQTQFVSHRVRRNVGRLDVRSDSANDDSGPPMLADSTEPKPSDSIEISSSFDFDVRDLVIRTRDGRYWGTADLAAGQSATAKAIINPQDVSRRLGELYTRYRLVGAASQGGRSRRDRRVGDLILFLNREVNPGAAVVGDGTFELWMNQTLFIKGDLPPGTFAGISDPSSDVIAVETAEQKQSVRYVMGTLP